MSKPPPFRRPSVDMDRHGRVWKHVEAKKVKKGDVVSDKGLVAATHSYHSLNTTTDLIEVYYVSGEVDVLSPSSALFAFVRREDV